MTVIPINTSTRKPGDMFDIMRERLMLLPGDRTSSPLVSVAPKCNRCANAYEAAILAGSRLPALCAACSRNRYNPYASTASDYRDIEYSPAIKSLIDDLGRGSVRAEGAALSASGFITNIIKEENTVKNPCQAGFKAMITVYRKDVKVRRKFMNAKSRRRVKSVSAKPRSEITELSKPSLRRMVFTARNMTPCTHMVTLTYPADFPTDGELVKYQLKKFRQWLTYQKIGGFWWLEFQERGAPHFHLLITSYLDHRKLRKYWYNLVNSGDLKHYSSGTQVQMMREEHAAAAYAAKYAAKAEQKDVPEGYTNVGRFWGKFGGVKLEEIISVSGDLNRPELETIAAESLVVLPPGSKEVQEQLKLQLLAKWRGVPSDSLTDQNAGEVALYMAPAIRVVSRMYSDDRDRLRATNPRVKPAFLGYGTRGFTAYDMADKVSRVLVRLGHDSVN